MKRWTILAAFVFFTSFAFAQKDSSSIGSPDTIKVGNFVIVKKKTNNAVNIDINSDSKDHNVITINSPFINHHKKRKSSNLSTNWWIFDLGFTNVRDNTNYTAAQSMGYFKTVNGSPVNQNSFALNTGKSSNVNLWLFMQKLNLSEHVLNLKYGFGLEMYNFRYDHNLSYRKDPSPYVFNDTIGFSKNKLYAGYLTVPIMLNVNTSPRKRNGLTISAGVSAGYLVGSHAKQISAQRGKQKYHGDLGLQPWRLAAITELGLGPIRLYGSYSFNALHKENTGLDQTPYAIGIRFSNW
jgi:hypothetical protein